MKCPRCHSENPETLRLCAVCGTELVPPPKDPRLDVTKTLEIPVQEPTVGTVLAGRYRIIQELGRGGMGRVFLVFDTDVNEKIALKLLNPEIAADGRTIERFSQELKLARKIRHKNICGMFDLGKAEGALYLTMEFVPGEDLKRLIRRRGPLPAEKTIPIAAQICEGLAEAHRLGVVHRDLKPSNIMVDEDGNARIMDFGIARSVREEGITEAGVMIGTPEYMSPEQVEGKPADQRSDIYSLGIILYEMLTGRVPFEGDTPLSVAHKQKYEQPPDPRKLNPQIPEDLSQLILICLEKEAGLRYQTAGDLLDDLTRIEQGLPTKGRKFPRAKPPGAKEIRVRFNARSFVWPALIVVGLVLAGLAVWRFALRKPASQLSGQKPSIAVISFENQTGDKAYDYLSKGIPDMLGIRLEQSGYLNVTTWDRLQDLLKQAKRPDVQFIDKDLGLELCRLDGAEVLAQGSFIKTGSMIAINVRLFDVASNRLLKTASSRGEGETSILKSQIDELSKDIAGGVGISKRLVTADTAKTAETMTSSPEAYKWYVLGQEALSKLYYDDARRYLEKAVEIDPSFAMAFWLLARTYPSLLRANDARLAIIKAKELSGRLTERDRLLVEARYAYSIEKDLPKRDRIAEEVVRKYPKDKTSLISLADIYSTKDEFDKAIDLYAKACVLDPYDSRPVNTIVLPLSSLGRFDQAIARIKDYLSRVPGDANSYDNLGLIYILSGDLDKAIAAFHDSSAIKPDLPYAWFHAAYALYLKEDYGEALNRLDRIADVVPSPVSHQTAYLQKAFSLYWLGRRTKALSALEAAEELVKQNKQLSGQVKPFSHLLRSWILLESDEIELGRKEIEKTLAVSRNEILNSPDWECRGELALGYSQLKTGELDSAKASMEKARVFIEKIESSSIRNPLDHQLNHITAEIALQEGKAQNVAETFDRMAPYVFFPFPQSVTLYVLLHFPSMQDVKARAWLKLGEVDKAILEYERLITFDPKSRERFFIHPLYHYRLGKLYEKQGMKDKAKARYERFLYLWKDADPGKPEVEDARKRLAGLRDSLAAAGLAVRSECGTQVRD